MCHYRDQIAAAKNDLDQILEKNFNIAEICSKEDLEERKNECARLKNRFFFINFILLESSMSSIRKEDFSIIMNTRQNFGKKVLLFFMRK